MTNHSDGLSKNPRVRAAYARTQQKAAEEFRLSRGVTKTGQSPFVQNAIPVHDEYDPYATGLSARKSGK